ncbi:redoxin family protein [Duganella ginsengisoli]|uniref:Redoxin family protein n=2 Tax=Pseudoduganella ginsengisoli TaxID=1462440 RepID=A0A6L6Q367_9BURK|nr:redoxin family protein [Pseudoduganella ginsengisoli]
MARRVVQGAMAALIAALAPVAMAAPAAGAAAPAFDLPGDTGRISLDAYKGKVVYVDFWASWCGPCRKSFPWMNSLQQRYGGQGLQVVAINVDARRGDAADFLAKVPAAFAIAYDQAGATPRAYGIKGMPSSALVGRDGKLLWLHAGFNEADEAALDAQIKAALQLQ